MHRPVVLYAVPGCLVPQYFGIPVLVQWLITVGAFSMLLMVMIVRLLTGEPFITLGVVTQWMRELEIIKLITSTLGIGNNMIYIRIPDVLHEAKADLTDTHIPLPDFPSDIKSKP